MTSSSEPNPNKEHHRERRSNGRPPVLAKAYPGLMGSAPHAFPFSKLSSISQTFVS